MRTQDRVAKRETAPLLPRPPVQKKDGVLSIGVWSSKRLDRRDEREAQLAIEPMLLGEDEPSSLPIDPSEPPPLPDPPTQEPDREEKEDRPGDPALSG